MRTNTKMRRLNRLRDTPAAYTTPRHEPTRRELTRRELTEVSALSTLWVGTPDERE